jgi:predicted dehydrogenase
MARSPLRVGLLGYGFGGRFFHAPLITSAPGCELIGVVTRSDERRAELARDHPGTAAYGSLAELAAAGAQAVAISTPAATHTELTREAIALGLPVVCDKPFALDAATARETVQAAERAQVLLTVYQNRRWDSDLRTLRTLLQEGRLGFVRRFESRFERFAPDMGPPASGGGILLDFGTHLVDQALLLFGPARGVYAEMHMSDNEPGADDDFFAVLRHDGDVVSHLWGSWIQGAPGPRLRVTGSAGTFVVAEADGQEAALVAGRSPVTEGPRWGAEPQEHWGWLRRGETSEQVPAQPGRWDTFYPAFAAAVSGEGEVPVGPWDAVAALEVIDAARSSAATRRVVEVRDARVG